ncbi:MAG: type I glyceraldehyde-3-phosphate dehydrogenase [Halobacteriovoraceae bacterium]|jgi:glyceraldehyde-3-phosphate dehydrogenase type I|nr:type I glyceraldehyde-3-phosphate dehydrogenase [Halobacteriovoraceae bacterium]MBC97034.1 type I glyceraldehyde-3-phosphate dehydrogenase [Halobacteriovoraceae bacterium]|tara:strand:- start:15473 stop:16489 length:1017 start_codon:yes stop_codon:yes gene_type:complete
MAKIKVAINGMGRIGRTLVREFFSRNDLNYELVAVNNPGTPTPYIHLLKFDSVHGPFRGQIEYKEGDNTFAVNGNTIKFYNFRDPSEIPWGADKVDIVIDATGKFKDKNSLGLHKRDTVKKVVMCAPGKDLDGTFVMGINHEDYNHEEHDIVSNASCTTNCLAPVAKVLNDSFGIESGFMTTVHAYTSDQKILDNSHKDLRRARAAAVSMVPTTTGAAKAVGLVIPELKGKLDGLAIRVPTPNVSMVDLNVVLKENVDIETINNALIEAANGPLKGILKTESLPLVSCDYFGMRESSCVDLELTNKIDNIYKVITWYDNEAGFSNRVLDLVNHMGSKF